MYCQVGLDHNSSLNNLHCQLQSVSNLGIFFCYKYLSLRSCSHLVHFPGAHQMRVRCIFFKKANFKRTMYCKQKSCAQNAVQLSVRQFVKKQIQIPRSVFSSLHNGVPADYLHAGLDFGSISADSSGHSQTI